MLKSMQSIMPAEEYGQENMILYRRMKTMGEDFKVKNEELKCYNDDYIMKQDQQKTYIKSETVKSEPAPKKAKIVTVVKKSLFVGTPLDNQPVSKSVDVFTSPLPTLENFNSSEYSIHTEV